MSLELQLKGMQKALTLRIPSAFSLGFNEQKLLRASPECTNTYKCFAEDHQTEHRRRFWNSCKAKIMISMQNLLASLGLQQSIQASPSPLDTRKPSMLTFLPEKSLSFVLHHKQTKPTNSSPPNKPKKNSIVLGANLLQVSSLARPLQSIAKSLPSMGLLQSCWQAIKKLRVTKSSLMLFGLLDTVKRPPKPGYKQGHHATTSAIITTPCVAIYQMVLSMYIYWPARTYLMRCVQDLSSKYCTYGCGRSINTQRMSHESFPLLGAELINRVMTRTFNCYLKS
ncbi:hypothetical protein PROFUN_11411 [Planoprotostelium fungivorum]|uniref:Uncharacterized protein n=1 Tax=Planoprotostelium fungivorum TaxID=1890364 RepID=A0A2P6NA74_9EUKA|nr:hypothetical protein PROFUN_11411 [Planoprotostelium fungivorum]